MADTDIFFSYSVLPALSLEGAIFSDIVKGSYDGKKFVWFVDELMNVMNEIPILVRIVCWLWIIARYTMYLRLKKFVLQSMHNSFIATILPKSRH